MEKLEFHDVDTNILKENAIKDKPRRMIARTPAVWVTFKEGKEFCVRFLPPWTDTGKHAFVPYLKIFQHWDVGPDSRRIICPSKMNDGLDSCYVCEQMSHLYQTEDEKDKKLAKKMRASQGFIYQVIDRNYPIWVETDEAVAEDPSLLGRPKIQFMRVPWSGQKQILDFYNDPNYGNISHPLTGIDMLIKRTGTGLDTDYGIKGVIEEGRISHTPMWGTEQNPNMEMIEETLTSLYELDEHPFFKVNTYAETVAYFKGQEPEEMKSLVAHQQENSQHQPLPPRLPAGGKKGGMVLNPVRDEKLEVWIDAAKEYPVMDRDEVAKWGNKKHNQSWTGESIAYCYSAEPEHDDVHDGCSVCPLNGPCARAYYERSGYYSSTQPGAVALPQHDPDSDKGPEKDEAAELMQYLENEASGR